MKQLKYKIEDGDSVTLCPYFEGEKIGGFFCLNACAFFIELGDDYQEDNYDTIICEYEDLAK